jgi:AraC-like DNA-binding protein
MSAERTEVAHSPAMQSEVFGAIILTGAIRNSPGVSFERMRILGDYAIVYLTGGSGHYRQQGSPPMRCRKGDLLIVFPEIPHAYGPGPGEFWSEIYVVFRGAIFDLWRSHGLLDPQQPVIRLTGPAAARETSREMRGILRTASRASGESRSQLDMVCRLQAILSRAVLQHASPGITPVVPSWAKAAMDYVAAHPASPLEEAARAAGLSYESFRKKFRMVCGMAPAAWRDRQAMQLARKWIYEERLPNKEIADRLGYCDEFHFSRRFRQVTGQTPRSVRTAFFGKSGFRG